MSDVNETNLISVNVVQIKAFAIQNKNETTTNFDVSVMNQMIGVLVKNGCMWNPGTCNCECNKACKIDEYLDIKIV